MDVPTLKELGNRVLEGRPVPRFPVTSIYNHLYYMDHYAELTGEPSWRLRAWMSASPEEHLDTYKRLIAAAPFEMLQPMHTPSRENRERYRIVTKDGMPMCHDTRTDTWKPLDTTVSGHARDYAANESRTVYSVSDVDKQIKVTKAEELLALGLNDYADAAIAAMGPDNFVITGGVIGTFYSCTPYLGLTNLLSLVVEEPALVDYLSKRLLERTIESIRLLAAAGGDAILIDDATTTCDMISVDHYEQFSLPYVKAMVDEIHSHGQKAIVIYFGGVADRLEQIAATGADGLVMEASMKGYVNDIEKAVATIGDRVTLFSNIDPVGCMQEGTDEGLAAEIRRQVEAGAKGRGFVVSTASPITPSTPADRVRRFIELSKNAGEEVCRQTAAG